MHRKPTRRALLLFTLVSLLLLACGGPEASTTGISPDANQSQFGFGEPADAADTDRVVEIDTTDDLVFIPADLTVTTGETVTFHIVNDGTITHDFTLGDEPTQEEHAEEMAEMGGMTHAQPNTVTVAAGETRELTWTFTQPGTVLIGCHQPGHYDAGMKGQIRVEP